MYNNDEIMAAIWADPEKATGLKWTRRGSAWTSNQDLDGNDQPKSGGRTTLKRNDATGVLYISYNGDGFTPSQGIIKYLRYRWNTNDTLEVYQRLGEIYGIAPDLSDYTEAQRRRYEKRRQEQPILDAVAEYVTAALRTEKGKEARDYLATRGLAPSGRLGAISEEIIKDLKAALRRKYPALSYSQANKFIEDLFTIGKDKQDGNPYRIPADDYRLIGPYYNGTHVAGFWLRLTSAATTWTDKTGIAHKRAKYLYNDGLAKGGYCGTLRASAPAILVEGQLDAERLQQEADRLRQEAAQATDEEKKAYKTEGALELSNVLALGGVAPTDSPDDAARSQIKTLQRYGIKKLVYVPDLEYYTDEDEAKGRGKARTMKTAATGNTIKALAPYLSDKTDGDGFISLKIAELYNNPEDPYRKQDADAFLRERGAAAFLGVLHTATNFWTWQLEQAAATLEGDDLQAAALRIYGTIPSPLDKEILKADLTRATTGYLATLRDVGFNASSLTILDRSGKASTYREEITAASAALARAIEDKATPEQIGEILRRAATAQAKRTETTAAGFMAQANATPEQIEAQIKAQADYIETDWLLYRTQEQKGTKEITEAVEVRPISFAPAAISIIAAPTNYGKTAVMMQTALHLAARGDKRYIYLSTEEDQRQMYLRACAGYIGDKWPADSHPRKDLRQSIKYDDLPEDLFTALDLPFNLEREKAAFNRAILPNLRLIYCNDDAPTLCTKLAALVEDWRNEGIEVGGIFIDYLQMIRTTGRSFSRTDEMQVICAELNALAKSTGLPLILGAQLNRQATQGGNNGVGFDGVELANIGDSTGIERIANDVYLVWNTDKMKEDQILDKDGNGLPYAKLGYRTRRVVKTPGTIWPKCLYIENMKARDYETGAYGLLAFNGATGHLAARTHITATLPRTKKTK